MNDVPLVTIITPSFNHARYLRQCIDSVLDQRWPRLQYLVLDGGSADGSIEILKSYGEAISWRSRRDRGQAAAINAGLAEARGEIVAWLNSDDYYLPHAIERAVECLQRQPRAAMTYGRALMVDDAGRTQREYPTFRFNRSDLARKCYICQPSVFLRRWAIEQAGPLNERLDICLDYEWWLRIGAAHELAFCDHVLSASRHYSTTKTSARRLRALVEAGYLMRQHFGGANWHWAAKWVAHRWKLRRGRFVLPVAGWIDAARCARRYRRRFDASCAPSRYGRKVLISLHVPHGCPRAGSRHAMKPRMDTDEHR